MKDEQEKKLFVPNAEEELNPDLSEFDESILDDEFAHMLKNGLDAAFDEEEISVSDELFARTLAAIEESKKEDGQDGKKAEITPISKGKPWWKKAAPFVAAAFVIGIGVFMLRMNLLPGVKKKDMACDTAAYEGATSASEADGYVLDSEPKYTYSNSIVNQNKVEMEASASFYAEPDQGSSGGAASDVAAFTECVEDVSASSAGNIQSVREQSTSGTNAGINADKGSPSDVCDETKEYSERGLTLEESEEFLMLLETTCEKYNGESEAYVSETAEGLKSVLYLYIRTDKCLVVARRFLCYENRVIVIDREEAAETRTVYLVKDSSVLEKYIN